MSQMNREMERDKRLWIPTWLKQEDHGQMFGEPVDGDYDEPDPGGGIDPRKSGEIEVADEETLREEVRRHGRVEREPEIGRHEDEPMPPPGAAAFGMGYSDTYWTHFDFRQDVAGLVRRIQAKFPYLLYSNTYYMHPPVHGRKYEFVSVDRWGGGLNAAGEYVGYRGKPLPFDLGKRVFNAIFNAPGRPYLYWTIYRGRMWTRGYGWGPSPGGPPGSDPRHDWHIHETYLL